LPINADLKILWQLHYLAFPLGILFLIWLGIYSFEIYLLHWPLLSRYNFLFKFLPAGLATFLYLPILLGLAYLMNKLIDKLPLVNKKTKDRP
jgi:peptidoglycan/LPS O-acetylase OafA/YrhL